MTKRYFRARKPEQKEERKQHLLDVARTLIDQESDLNLLSLNEIARSAKMAKANIYRYFESREALLLDLLWDEWQDWFQDFQNEWSKVSRSKKNFNYLIKILSKSIARRDLLCNLSTALPSVIEKNLKEATIREFKYRSIELFSQIANYLEACSNELDAGAYAVLLQDTVSFIAGTYPFSNPNDVVARVLQDPKLHFFKRDLGEELGRYIMAIANSLKSNPFPK